MIVEFFKTLLHPESLIMTVGTVGIIVVIFIETGLFFGFFFPGDSLIFTAGYLATFGYVSFPALLIGVFAAAVFGDSVGYAFGKKVGPAIFTKDDSLFFNRKHIARAQHFYEKHGKKTIILARFLPIVRTFAPIVAGVGNMGYKTFLTYNIIGGFIWSWGALWLGYGFGSLIPNPDRFIIPAVLVIILLSASPAVYEIVRQGIKKLKDAGN